MIHGGNVWQGASPDAWLDFSANLRPEGPPSWVRAALGRAMGEVKFYPDLAMGAAREGIAAYAGVPAACVLPTAGGIEAIDCVCRAGTGRVIVHPPTFGEYARRAAACGRALASGDAKKGDTVFLCNPNNPTGAALSRERVLEMARTSDAKLCVDEAFVDFCPEISVRERAAAGELVVVGSLTKALCVPGVRLGYLIAAPEAVKGYEKCAVPWSLNAFAAAIARELPGHLDKLDEDRKTNMLRREALAAALRGLDADVFPSRTNFLLADFRRPMDAAAERLKAKGILVRTCASFGLGDSFLRVAVKTEAENARLVRVLSEAIS